MWHFHTSRMLQVSVYLISPFSVLVELRMRSFITHCVFLRGLHIFLCATFQLTIPIKSQLRCLRLPSGFLLVSIPSINLSLQFDRRSAHILIYLFFSTSMNINHSYISSWNFLSQMFRSIQFYHSGLKFYYLVQIISD